MSLRDELVEAGLAHGAVAVGVCRAEPFVPELATLLAHRASGRSGPLHFTYEDPQMSADITRSFPWARSLVVLAADYLARSFTPAANGAVIGRFATADHYRLLDEPARVICERLSAAGHRAETLSDDTRLLDRAAAIRSGVGWRGKSTMVLGPSRGPWTLFGTVVTDADLETTAPMVRGCGTCDACLPACPTSALDDEGLDARRCLSTWLQTGGTIPHWIRHQLDRRIYGCDDCLTSCPPGHPAMRAAPVRPEELPFDELLTIDDDALLTRFAWWYVPHRDPRILRRNILVAAGNSKEKAAVTHIASYLNHRSALLRGHSAWALARSAGADAIETLNRHLVIENEPTVRDEVLLAMLMIEDPDRYAFFLKDDETVGTGGYPPPPMRTPVTTAIRAIRGAGIEYEPHLFDYESHQGAVGAAEALGVDLHLTVKTIVFETSNGDGVIALMNGDHEVSTGKLARHLGVKKVTPASADRARKWTGYEFGGTSPFGTRQPMRLVMHEEIEDLDRIYINAGSRGFLVEMAPSDLMATLSPEVADLKT